MAHGAADSPTHSPTRHGWRPARSLAASTRTSGRRGRSAASSRSCRWRSAITSATPERSEGSGFSPREPGGGATPAHGRSATRIDSTRAPGVLSRRGRARDPRGALGSADGRPGRPDRQFGRSLAARAISPCSFPTAHRRAPCPAARAAPGATEGGSGPSWAGATPTRAQSCHKSSSEFEPSWRPLRRSARHRVRGAVGQVGPVTPVRRPRGRTELERAAQLRNGRSAHA